MILLVNVFGHQENIRLDALTLLTINNEGTYHSFERNFLVPIHNSTHDVTVCIVRSTTADQEYQFFCKQSYQLSQRKVKCFLTYNLHYDEL